jgi:predicted DsbA family dithiol-disulfide isomerase
LLKQALQSNPLKVAQSTLGPSTQSMVKTQQAPIQAAPFVFIPQNLGVNGTTPESRLTTFLPLM